MKYGKSIAEIKTKYEQGQEDFEQYDDLMVGVCTARQRILEAKEGRFETCFMV